MITYDIYEITYMADMPDENLTKEEVCELVLNKGDWDLSETYFDKDEAWRMWNGKWSKMAYTEKDMDDDILHYSVFVMEKSERDDNEEVIDSTEMDYAVEPFIRSQVRNWM